MSDFLITVLSSLLASGALAAALIWITRAWLTERLKSSIAHEYNQKLERFKAELSASNNVSIERLKADLRVESQRRETQFMELHKKRAETIEQIHAVLQDLALAVNSLYQAKLKGGDIQDATTHVDEQIAKFSDYFRPNKIFLPKNLEEEVLELSGAVIDSATESVRIGKAGDNNDALQEEHDKFQALTKELFSDLKAEFRRLLGDPD